MFTDAAPFQRCSVLIKQSFRTFSWPYSRVVYKTEHNMSRALNSVQRGKSQTPGIVAGSLLTKKKVPGCWVGSTSSEREYTVTGAAGRGS